MHTTLSSIPVPDVKKYDVHTIPTEFMMDTDVVAQARNMVAALEQTQQHQVAADRLYKGITGILHQQMYEHLPCRMNRRGSSQRKPPHSYKPW